MPSNTNHLGQPVGFAIDGWKAPPAPSAQPMQGRYCRLEHLDPDAHSESLFNANALDTDGRMWTYMFCGPFDTSAAYRQWVEGASRSTDPLFFAIVDAQTDKPVGVASFMRIDRPNGVIEVGNIAYSPLLQRTRAATEAMFLMMQHAFESGYRRYEWKCNALNAASRAAAMRLGFSYEGVFRQAAIAKDRNRDTAWYAAIDQEWPELKAAYLRWLDPANFDAAGRQKLRLSDLTAPVLKQCG